MQLLPLHDKHLLVFVPGLIPHRNMIEPLLRELHLPTLARLLARGERQILSSTTDVSSLLCSAVGIAQQTDWPIAPIALKYEQIAPQHHFWLRADPVHLRAERDQLQLVDSGAFHLAIDEAHQFADAFNHYFSAQGLQLLTPHPKRWYLRAPSLHDISTHSVQQASGLSINRTLPSGSDSMAWHRLFNEIQMLFFELPVNLAREARGELPINSVWFWGGGTLPTNPTTIPCDVWSNDYEIHALVRFAGGHVQPIPEQAPHAPNTGLFILDALQSSAQYGDYASWQIHLQQLEQHWFSIWLKQLISGQLHTLDICSGLHTLASCSGQPTHTLRWRIHRRDLLKVWRSTNLIQSLTAATLPHD